MDKQMHPQAPSDEISGSHHLSGTDESEDAWIYFDQGNSKEPSIPAAIALILGAMLLGILLATHWPFRKF
jgi:hypothetical protein